MKRSSEKIAVFPLPFFENMWYNTVVYVNAKSFNTEIQLKSV